MGLLTLYLHDLDIVTKSRAVWLITNFCSDGLSNNNIKNLNIKKVLKSSELVNILYKFVKVEK